MHNKRLEIFEGNLQPHSSLRYLLLTLLDLCSFLLLPKSKDCSLRTPEMELSFTWPWIYLSSKIALGLQVGSDGHANQLWPARHLWSLVLSEVRAIW